MQFSFSKADALKILRTVLRAVPESHALPALICFHLRADPDSYELTVTGGNETSRYKSQCRWQYPMAALLRSMQKPLPAPLPP